GEVLFHVKRHPEVNAREFYRVVETVRMVGKILENAIKFESPINVLINYHDFCQKGTNCSYGTLGTRILHNSSLGFTSPTHIEVTVGEGTVIYPQSLHRQGKHAIKYTDLFDMKIHLNAKGGFLFPHDYGLSDHQVDLIKTILHEMFHGLGFSPSLMVYKGHVTPYPYSDQKPIHPCDTFPPSVFVNHMYAAKTDQPISHLINKLNKEFKANCTATWENYGIPLQPNFSALTRAAHHLTKLSTTDKAIYFKTFRNDTLYLETSSQPFAPASSLSHSDNSYVKTIEHMMTSTTGEYHQDFSHLTLNPTWITAPIGPITLDVMATLGYSLNPNPELNASQAFLYKGIAAINRRLLTVGNLSTL
ncbi:hypothetical protein L0F63_003546, partial [Massospora cicadina]